MNEDTREAILRLQREDLRALWNTPTDYHVEIEAALIVYCRQRILLDGHIESARQRRISESAGVTPDNVSVATDFPIPGVDTPFMSPSMDPTINATSVHALLPVSDRPIVRLPSSQPPEGEQLDKRDMRVRREATRRYRQARETREDAERKDGSRKQMNSLRTPVKNPQRLQPVPSRARPGEDMTIDDIFEVQEQKKVERMMVVVPGRAISVLYKALKNCYGNFDDAIDMIFRQEAEECPKTITSNIEDSDSELKRIKAQSRPFSQQIGATTRDFANGYSTKPKSTMTTSSAAVDRSSSLVSTEPTPSARTNLKRSADHFAASDGLPSKKKAGTILKNGLDPVPGVPAREDTIVDKFARFEALLRSSRSLPSSTLPSKKKKTRRGTRGGLGRKNRLGTGTRELSPDPKFELPEYVSTETKSMTPGLPSGMVRPEMGHHGQGFGSPQLDSFPQTLHRTPPAPPNFDIKAFDAATPIQRKQMLGQALYPKIQTVQPQLVGKITGMLLDLDDNELLSLTIDDAALCNKIEEAMCVYNDYLQGDHDEDA